MSNGVAEKVFTEGSANQSIQFQANNDLKPEMGFLGFGLSLFNNATLLPGWWTPSRDVFLRSTLHDDSLLAGIVYGETARVKNMTYRLEVDKKAANRETKLKAWQDTLNMCQFGQGVRTFLHKFTLDYLTQDNGAFIEIIGKGGDRNTERPLDKGNIYSFAVLDAAQCWRTYDPEFPVIYVNPYNGKRHVMHYSRVFYTANFEQNRELARGIGFCPLSRSYEAARLIPAVNTYIYEKVTGQSPELAIVNGMSIQQFYKALLQGNAGLDNKGLTHFKDTSFIAGNDVGAGAPKVEVNIVGLKGLPDGFDRQKELEVSVFILSTAFGVDPREIWGRVSSGQTKADAEVQDEKSEGKGRADAMQALEDFFNWRVLPDDITFHFDKSNSMADERQAMIYQMRASARQTQLASGEINIEEARTLAAEAGDIPPEFLERQVQADDSTAVQPDNQPAIEQSEDVDDGDEQVETGEKVYSMTRNGFFASLLSLCQLGTSGLMARRTFTTRAKNLVSQYAFTAYLDGIRQGAGNQTITLLDPEETAELKRLTNFQIANVTSLSGFIYDEPIPSFSEVVDRVHLWANKGLDTIFNAGLLTGSKNKMMKWQLGHMREKHCATCAKADGQIHRARDWKRANIVPRSDNLLCNGFQCGCELIETTERAQGRLSRIPTHGKLAKILHRLVGI